MKNELINSKAWFELRATLQFVEGKILRILDIRGWMSQKELEELVKDYLLDRHVILNKMFRLHVTEHEVARFREVNDHLLELTRKMFREHSMILDSLASNPIEAISNGEDIDVESTLDVDDGAEGVRCWYGRGTEGVGRKNLSRTENHPLQGHPF